MKRSDTASDTVRRIARMAAIAFFAQLTCACASANQTTTEDESTLLGQDGTDANEIESQASSLTASLTLAPAGSSGTSAMQPDAGSNDAASGDSSAPAPSAPTPDQILGSAENTSTFYYPASCLTVNKNRELHQVTYTFNHCRGPWGLSHVSGEVVVVYSHDATLGVPGLRLDASGTGLKLHRATVDYRATAIVTGQSGERTMIWDGTLSGTTPRGRTFSRTAHWNTHWNVGDTCMSLDGHSEGHVTGRNFRTDVRDYARCRGECPENGGDIKITRTDTQQYVEIKFSGTNEAAFQGLDGQTRTLTLACAL